MLGNRRPIGSPRQPGLVSKSRCSATEVEDNLADTGAQIYLTKLGLGTALSVRALADVEDDSHRYAASKARVVASMLLAR
jgi:hypothetical protein